MKKLERIPEDTNPITLGKPYEFENEVVDAINALIEEVEEIKTIYMQDAMQAKKHVLESPKPEPEWPQEGDVFFYLTPLLRVNSDKWESRVWQQSCRKAGHCFRTEAEAIAARDRIKQVLGGTNDDH